MTDLEKAERRLLEGARVTKPVSSAELIAKAESAAPALPADTVRLAYWGLVSEGKLERTDRGVRRRA
jgi:hypothetical protein